MQQYYLIIEQLKTVWNGMCLKIKFEYFSLDLNPTFHLSFSQSLSLDEVPMPEIYLTSEENAYGILNYGWANGEELKIDLEGVEQVFFGKIQKYLKKISNKFIFLGHKTICNSSKIYQSHFNMQ